MTFLIVITAFYFMFCLIVTLANLSWRREKSKNQPSISVIVAMRNESENIERCLDHICTQKYPNYEIILVDDHSDDDSYQLAQEMQNKYPQLNIFRSKRYDNIIGKKAALMTGIENATGEWLVFTDADCFPPPTWLKTLASYTDKANFLLGISPHIIGRNFFLKLREIERTAIDAITAGFMRLNIGLTGVARNMAYTKKLFREIGGYDGIGHYLSGDDALMINKATRSGKALFRFVFDKTAQVPTLAPDDLSTMWHQERRRVSLFDAYPWWLFLIVTPIVMFYFAIAIILVLAIIGTLSWKLFFGLLIIKLVSDCLLLISFWHKSKQMQLLPYLLAAEIVHLPYMIIFSILGLFPKVNWKGRADKLKN